MRFFVDNNLSPGLAKGMKGFGEDVVHLQDYFSPDADDELWLAHIGPAMGASSFNNSYRTGHG